MKILFFLSLLIFHTTGHCQQINGIGLIQLGKTETQILTDLKIDKKKVVEGTTKPVKFFHSGKSTKSFVRFQYDPYSVLIKDITAQSVNLDYELELWGIQKCKDAVSYQLPKYEIDGISIQFLNLIFYKDTLIKIYYLIPTRINNGNQQFLAIFESKYGEPKKSSSSTNTDGKRSSLTDLSWISTVPDILVKGQEFNSYNDNGQFGTDGTSIFSFSIENLRIVKLLEQCNESGVTNDKNKNL